MLIIIIAVIILAILSICLFIKIFINNRKNASLFNETSDYCISQDRIDSIKNKYKNIDNFKKVNIATEDDVENFYKEQMFENQK